MVSWTYGQVEYHGKGEQVQAVRLMVAGKQEREEGPR
jgi:hypothetical protein